MGKLIFYCVLCSVFVALQQTLPIEARTTEPTTNTTASANEGNSEGASTTTPVITITTTNVTTPTTNETATTTTTNETTTTTTTKETTTSTTAKPDVSTLGTGENSQDYMVEFEDGLDEIEEERYMIFRSEASKNRTVHFTAEDSDRRYEVTLCVQGSGDHKVQFQVIGMMYSNDGPSDEISVALDGKVLGTAETDEVYDGGNEWNVFKDSGPIGKATALDNGNYTLSMTVKTDQWGVELDTITIRSHNQDPAENIICRSELI